MAPIITVFRFDENVCESVIKTLDKYYTCFVDGKTLLENIDSVYTKPYGRYFVMDPNLKMIDSEDVGIIEPAFVIHMDEELGVGDWTLITKFLLHVFGEIDDEDGCKAGRAFFPDENNPKLAFQPAESPVVPKPYQFRGEKSDDTVFYEIKRPNGDVYTVVLDKFSETGMLPLFTDLFICNSWGNLAADRAFLKALWDREMKEEHGEFDLDKLLKDATKACFPSEGKIPKSEPKVYRRELKDVRKTLRK